MQIHVGEQLFSKRKGFHVFMQIAIYTLFINTALVGLVCLVVNPLCASVELPHTPIYKTTILGTEKHIAEIFFFG